MDALSKYIAKITKSYKHVHTYTTDTPIHFVMKTTEKKVPRHLGIQATRIIKIIQYVYRHAPSHVKRKAIAQNYDYIFEYVPTRYKKSWKKGAALTIESIQSGMTRHEIHTNNRATVTMCVFRYEEALKVAFHELLHGLEYHCFLSSTFVSWTHPNLETEQSLDESLVETWATIGVCRDTLKLQGEFSVFQAAKVLTRHGYHTWQDFWVPSKVENKTLQLPAVPAVFSYYILKSAYLFKRRIFEETFPLRHMGECNRYTFETLRPFLENKRWQERLDYYMSKLSKEEWLPWDKNTMRTTI